MPNIITDDTTSNVNSNMVASSASPKRSFQLILPASPRVLQQAKFGGGVSHGGGANTAFSSSSSSLSTLSLSLGNGEAFLWPQLIERLRQNHQLLHRHQNLHDVEQQIRATSSALYDPATLSAEQQIHLQPNSPPLTPQSPTDGGTGTADLVEHIVRVTKGQYLNVGVPSFSSPGLCPYLYVHSVKRERRILAQLVKYKKRSASPSSSATAGNSQSSSSSSTAAYCKPVYTTQKLSIPLNYAGFFEILSEDGRATRCIHSVSELLRRFPDACIVRSTGVRAYSPMVLAHSNLTVPVKRSIGNVGGSASTLPYESLPNDGYYQDGDDDADATAGDRSQFVSSVAASRQENTANSGGNDLVNVAVRFDKYRLLHPGERLVLVDSFKAVIENNNATTNSTLHYYRDCSGPTSGNDRQTAILSSGAREGHPSQLQVESFLRCFDEAGGTVLLHIGDKGKFSPIAREEQISGVHTVQNLLRKRFPLTVRLVCGAVPLGLSTKKSSIWPPIGGNSSSSAAPTAAAFNSNSNGYVVPNSSSAPQPLTFAMRLLRCYEEEFAQVFVWSQKEPLVLSIPLSGTMLKVVPAKNMSQLRLDADVRALSSNMLRFLTERGGSNACLQMLTEKESAAHDILTAAAASSASSSCLTSDHQFLSADQLSANNNNEHQHQSAATSIQKRRTKKSSLLNLSAKVHSSGNKSASKLLLQSPPCMQQQQPPLKWTYDEIDQIYDYVRGLAPPPATPFEIREDDDDAFGNDQQANEHQADSQEVSIANNYAVPGHNVTAAHVESSGPAQQRFKSDAPNNTAEKNADLAPPPPCYFYDAALGTYLKPSPPPPVSRENTDTSQRPHHRRHNSKTHDRRRNTTDSIRTSSALPPPIDAVKYMPPPPPPIETIPTSRTYQHMRAFQHFGHSASQDMLNVTGSSSNYPQQHYNYVPPQTSAVVMTPPTPQQVAAPSSSRKLLFSKFKYKSMNQLPTMHVSPPQQLLSTTSSKRPPLPIASPTRRIIGEQPPVVVARDRRGVICVDSNNRTEQQQSVAVMTPTSTTDEPPYANMGMVESSPATSTKHQNQTLPLDDHFIDVDCGIEDGLQQQFVVEHSPVHQHKSQRHSSNDQGQQPKDSILDSGTTLTLKTTAKPHSRTALGETDAKLYSCTKRTVVFSPKSTEKEIEQRAHDDDAAVQENTVRVRLRPVNTTTPNLANTKADHSPRPQEISNNNTARVPFVRHDGQPQKFASISSYSKAPSADKKVSHLSLPIPPSPITVKSETKTFKTSSSTTPDRHSLFLPGVADANNNDPVFLRESRNSGKPGGVLITRVRHSAAFDEALDDSNAADENHPSKGSTPTGGSTSAANMFGKLKHVTRVCTSTNQQSKISGSKTMLATRVSNTAAVDSGTGTASSSSASSAASLDGLGINNSPVIGGGTDRSCANNVDNNEASAEQRSVHARIQKFHNMLVGSNGSVAASVGCRKGDTNKLQQQQHETQVLASPSSMVKPACVSNGSKRKVVGLIYV